VYLLAELGKFSNEGDVRSFFDKIGEAGLAQLEWNAEPEEIALRFRDQASVSNFVEHLSDAKVMVLVRLCAIWRDNGILGKLSQGTEWTVEEVPIAIVDLQQAEPQLGPVFAKNDFRLTAIASDPEVLRSEPYCLRVPGQAVDYPVLLGVRSGGRFRVFDGMHRAIQLVRNGERVVKICASE
jgi:hypothetical protein